MKENIFAQNDAMPTGGTTHLLDIFIIKYINKLIWFHIFILDIARTGRYG